MFKLVCLLNNVIIDALDFPRLLKILPDNIYLIVVEKEHFNTQRVFNLKNGKMMETGDLSFSLILHQFRFKTEIWKRAAC